MDIQVNREQIFRVVIKWLNMYFGDLTPKTSNDLYNSIYYVNLNDEVMMEYDAQEELVYIDYDFWSKIESLFHLNYNDTQSIMKVWLEEKPYELVGIKPIKSVSDLELEEDWLTYEHTGK